MIKKTLLAIIILVALVEGGYYVYNNYYTEILKEVDQPKKGMKISSPAFANNFPIPKKYTCDENNFNPPLNFAEVPKEAKSMALIVDDPDAPAKTWTHWVLFNINPSTTQIAENTVPSEAIQGINDSSNIRYDGPCPPFGTHRYFFKIYALDTTLNLSESATKQEVEKAMQKHILDSAELVGTYER